MMKLSAYGRGKSIVFSCLVIALLLLNYSTIHSEKKIKIEQSDQNDYFISEGTWAKRYYEMESGFRLQSPLPLQDGGIIVTGWLYVETEYTFLAKFDRFGNIIWQKKFLFRDKYTNNHYYVSSFVDVLSKEGNLIMVASVNSRLAVLKFDFSGEVIWQRAYKYNSNYIENYPTSIIQSNDGGYIIAVYAETARPDPENEDCTIYSDYSLILKLDKNGIPVWNKRFFIDRGYYCNDPHVFATAMAKKSTNKSLANVSSNGTYVLTTYDNEHGNIIVIKFDNDGKIIWQKAYNTNSYFSPQCINPTSDGGYIIPADKMIFKLDSSGNIQWQKELGIEEIESMSSTNDGGYIVGSYGTPFVVLKLNQSGNILWQKNYQAFDQEELRDISPIGDEGYIFLSQDYGSQFAIYKVDTEGNIGTHCPIVKNSSNKATETYLKPLNANKTIGEDILNAITSFKVILSDFSIENELICKPDYGFSIKCQPTALSAVLPISNCTIESYGNFNSAINLSCSDLPKNANCNFSSNPVFPIAGTSISDKLIIRTDHSVRNGTYSFEVIAQSGLLIYTIPMKLTVIY